MSFEMLMRNCRIYLFIYNFLRSRQKRLFMNKFGQIVNNQILYTYRMGKKSRTPEWGT